VKTNNAPLISFIVVNWNGEKFLSHCLEALKSQTYSNFQIIIVDNASTDGSVDNIEEKWPDIRLIRLEDNSGFASANNIGANQAEGNWLALVNNDAFLAPDWLEKMVIAISQYPQYSSFASRLMSATVDDKVEATGDVFHVSGLAWHRDYNQIRERASRNSGEVFSASAAAALYNRENFLEVGGFDECYFSHHEDVDLGFRLRLRGYRCMYVPEAEVRHIGSASFGKESDKTVYQMHRNTVWTYFKDMPGRLLWKYLFAHLLGNLVFLIYYSIRGQWKAIWGAKFDALRGLPSILKERRIIQESRQIDVQEIEAIINRSWFGPYTLGGRSKRIVQFARFFGIDS
jgi:GT2 family glycosyltransferase